MVRINVAGPVFVRSCFVVHFLGDVHDGIPDFFLLGISKVQRNLGSFLPKNICKIARSRQELSSEHFFGRIRADPAENELSKLYPELDTSKMSYRFKKTYEDSARDACRARRAARGAGGSL